MIKNLAIVFRYFLFWLLFFFIERSIFILYFAQKLRDISFWEIGRSFLVGLWMDASMTAYISSLPLLTIIFLWFFSSIRLPSNILKWYNSILVIAFSIICVFNFNIYREWGSKINYKAIEIAITSPNEAIASSTSSPVLRSFLVLALLVALSLWLSRKVIIHKRLVNVSILIKIVASVLLIGTNFLAIRGGWQLSPINESMAYYSHNPLLNHAAVNTEWALLRDILNNKSNKNPYHYFDAKEADRLVNELLVRPKGPSLSILKTQTPNIVLIIYESFTADLVASLNGEKGTAPELEKLIKDGILFENAYASGDRTDKGVVAVLNGFPSQAIRSVMKINNKQQRLPSLSESLLKNGYQTSFFYGGESEFFNMKSYLLSHSYQKIIDIASFDQKNLSSKWGAFDEAVYDKLIVESRGSKQPFFTTLLTLTNHEPFDVPGKPHFPGDNVENKFRSTAFYADSCLGSFVAKAKKESWYQNTLFIVVADHGHRLPKNLSEIYHPNRFRIPLLFFGNVINTDRKGSRISKICSQTDLAATVLTQLGLDSKEFKWSRDVLNTETSDFAFFDWDNGFGVSNGNEVISFDNTGKKILFKKSNQPDNGQLLRYGKAYMQSVYQEYLNL